MANVVATPLKVLVPDIGGFKDVSVIDVLVKDGQQIDKETPLITIETEKAAMDVPAPVAGRVQQVKVKPGDKVSEGSLILLLEARAETDAGAAGAASATSARRHRPPRPRGAGSRPAPAATAAQAGAPPATATAGAAPSARVRQRGCGR